MARESRLSRNFEGSRRLTGDSSKSSDSFISSTDFEILTIGGHAAFDGASNIENGLTIDLINLNQVTVSADKKQTSVGPGNVWYDVYTKLDPLGLSTIGGRVSAIGTSPPRRARARNSPHRTLLTYLRRWRIGPWWRHFVFLGSIRMGM